jgi:pimeloyl-ACP methyl ester carboxylesterase
VIVHGFLGMSDNWKTLGTQFANEGFQVHALDLRNHGKSFHSEDFSYDIMVEDVKQYCDYHHLTDINIIGHSMGGMVATRFALMYPESVQKLILVNAIGLEDYKVLTPFKGFDELYSGELENNEDKIRNYQIQFYYL